MVKFLLGSLISSDESDFVTRFRFGSVSTFAVRKWARIGRTLFFRPHNWNILFYDGNVAGIRTLFLLHFELVGLDWLSANSLIQFTLDYFESSSKVLATTGNDFFRTKNLGSRLKFLQPFSFLFFHLLLARLSPSIGSLTAHWPEVLRSSFSGVLQRFFCEKSSLVISLIEDVSAHVVG